MNKELYTLWFNEKESQVYLYIVEYGVSAASEISRKLGIPKSTVNFIADMLCEKWILKKSFRSNTGYYQADIVALEQKILRDTDSQRQALSDVLPKLKEASISNSSQPKILFFDGQESCRSAYSDILHMKEKIFYEFGAHQDLEQSLGVQFMNGFIGNRIQKGIHCTAIGTQWEVMEQLQKNDEKHLRDLSIITNDLGDITSSIVVYDHKVLILNLNEICKWVLIENESFAETMKTIFRVCKW